MSKRLILPAAIGLFLATLPVSAQQLPVSEADDAYHFRYWIGTGHPADYTEWWYFNVYDSANNVQAIFTYSVTNPANILGQGVLGFGVAQVTSVAFLGDSAIAENDRYLLSAFSAEYDAADVAIGGNRISVIGRDHYRAKGSSRNGRISWDLDYQRSADSWYAANRVNVAAEPWQLMSWLLYMPRATVSGTVTVDGAIYQVNAPGYHDHNWGEWDLTGVPWNWAQYSQPGLSFDLGDFPEKPAGFASVDMNGQRFIFSNNQYTLVHTKWAYDPKNGISFPTQSVFQGNNGSAQVSLVMDVHQSNPISSNLPPPRANLVLYEQTSHFTGQFSAGGSPPVSVAGDGFKEFAAITP